MSTKATLGSRATAKAIAKSDKSAREARLASDSSALAKDAIKAAIAAACAAQRTNATTHGKGSNEATNVRKVAADVRLATEEAVERAKAAMRSEDKDDAIGATVSANLAARAAQRASSLAAAAAILAGKDREMSSGNDNMIEPTITVKERRDASSKEAERELADAIDRSACFLVTHNARIVATFAREEDAFLLESELAELDRAHGEKSCKCEVLDRKTGHRLGGYMLTADKMLVFVRDNEYERRFKGRRH